MVANGIEVRGHFVVVSHGERADVLVLVHHLALLDHCLHVVGNETRMLVDFLDERDVVSRDEREAGERMLLNFGHTLGHAIEKIYDFKGISHGMAVAIGMVLISKAGEKAGITKQGTAGKIADLCLKYGLPTTDSASFEEMAQAAAGDKKTSGSSINLVLLNKIGDSYTKKIKLDELLDFIKA